MTDELEFVLGGADLEMETIRSLLRDVGAAVHDRRLPWGAKASDYRNEIQQIIKRGNVAVLIELHDDLDLADSESATSIRWIDHHGPKAGKSVPTALEQVFQLLRLPAERWLRQFDLVAANDRGHVRGMIEFGASPDEMLAIRKADRQAQGISDSQEQAGREAAAKATRSANDRLTVVELPHSRTAAVTDILEKELGGPGFENLLILSPGQTTFFGAGRIIRKLDAEFPGGWYGGEMPERGFWGIGQAVERGKLIPYLEHAVLTMPANEIEVKAFHHTLLWPLIMRGGSNEKSIEPFVEAFSAAGWNEVTGYLNGPHEIHSYEEIVYFHPFVRDFLFGDGSDSIHDRTLRRMLRTDLHSMKVTIAPGQDPVTLRVERAELLLIRPRVVMLLLEFSNRMPDNLDLDDPSVDEPRSPLTLKQVLELQNRLRHIYPPYFTDECHGDCPVEVCWKNVDVPNIRTTKSNRGEFEQFVKIGAEPPAYSHWMRLFNAANVPDRVQCLRSAKDRLTNGLFLQQLIDDRMPSMSFVAVDNPDSITQEDQDCMIDFNPSGFAYQAEFQEQIRSQYRYDRFRHWGTTYYCNGTSLALVCNSGKFSNHLLTHFRRHYTHLAVIAQYQHAGLLYFADELADIAKLMANLDAVSDEEKKQALSNDWRDRLRHLQHRFLKFRTRSYFTEVSNQIQAKDLFRLWYDRLGTAELFDRVAQTSSEIYDAVENEEMKELTRAQKTLADVATWGLGATIFLTILSVVIGWAGLFPGDSKQYLQLGDLSIPWPWIWLAISILPAIAGWCLFSFGVKRLKAKRRHS